MAAVLPADLLLLDERAARLLARQQDLRTRGLLGVLAAAKRRGLLCLRLLQRWTAWSGKPVFT